MTQQLIAYVGKSLNEGIGLDRRALTDGRGNQIGTCHYNAKWPVRSYLGSYVYQIYATVDGTRYTGRGFGEGMAVKLRPTARQST
jgi:hypothetical protein